MSKDKAKDKTDPQDTGQTPDLAGDSIRHDQKVKADQDKHAEAEAKGGPPKEPVGPEGPKNEMRGGGAEPTDTDKEATGDDLERRYGKDAYGPPRRHGGEMGGGGAVSQAVEGGDPLPRAKAHTIMGALSAIDELLDKAAAVRERMAPTGDLGSKIGQLVSLGQELRQAFKAALKTRGIGDGAEPQTEPGKLGQHQGGEEGEKEPPAAA